MNDMPGSGDNGLLTVQEQQAAQEVSGAYLGMTPQESAALGQLDELKALSGAKERIILSYAVADDTGRTLREGEAVQAIRRLFPNMPVYGGLAQEERAEMLCAKAPALEALAVELSETADGRRELGRQYASAAAVLSGEEESARQLFNVTRGLGAPPDKRLQNTLARTLYGRPVSSVSRLETFAQCPYKHFVRYGLVPKREQRPGVDAAELGTLYHEAAERFTHAVTALAEFPEVSVEVCDKLMDEAVSPLIRRVAGIADGGEQARRSRCQENPKNGETHRAQHCFAVCGQQLPARADGVCFWAERTVADRARIGRRHIRLFAGAN